MGDFGQIGVGLHAERIERRLGREPYPLLAKATNLLHCPTPTKSQ